MVRQGEEADLGVPAPGGLTGNRVSVGSPESPRAWPGSAFHPDRSFSLSGAEVRPLAPSLLLGGFLSNLINYGGPGTGMESTAFPAWEFPLGEYRSDLETFS